MKVYTFSEARQKLAEVLDLARTEQVLIKRRGGETFVLSLRKSGGAPFDVPGVDRGRVTTRDIVGAVKHSGAQPWRKRS